MLARKVASMSKWLRPITTVNSIQSFRGKATAQFEAATIKGVEFPEITSVLPAQHSTAKVIFNNDQTADFKYIWLRDNCSCEKCIDVNTKQKIVPTANLNVNLKPSSLLINDQNQLEIKWTEYGGTHISTFDSKWLHKYGQSFMHNSFDSDSKDMEFVTQRPEIVLWNRAEIWKSFPELSYNEFMETDEGVRAWLEMFYKFGLALLRGVPAEPGKLSEVVKRFAYIKETQYGLTFDVISKPEKDAHLAYSGLALDHHTDMNYREKSPGMQLLHCLKANNPKLTGSDPGGRSFFVDGYRTAKWIEDNEPTAFHVLTSTPVRFSIKNDGMRYSALWSTICLNPNGDITEIHYNNRTMKPLQAPTHVITPFYHAYQLFSQKLREPSNGLEFGMLPGDLVAFNNRRVLHGRTEYDPRTADRHLQGCYVDIDEVFSKLDQLQTR